MPALESESAEKLIKLNESLVSACLTEAAKLRFNKEHPQQLYSVCIYASLIELAGGIDLLLDGEVKNITCVPILLRTFVEAYVAFRIVIKEPSYFKTMYASFAKQKLQLLKSATTNPSNPYLAALSEASDIQEREDAIKKELLELKAQGHVPLKIAAEFERADMMGEYQSIYWQLCMHAHNNISALEDRHIEKADNSYGVALFKADDPGDLIRYLDTLCAMLLEASLSIHGLFKTGCKGVFDEFSNALGKIRQGYIG